MNVSVQLANDGYFFATAASVGLSDEDVEAVNRGLAISQIRADAIRKNMDDAIMALARCPTIGGRC